MAFTTIFVHTVNVLILCFSITLLGLVAHSVSLKDRLDYAVPANLKGTGMSFLFWPARGGIVDFCLFLFFWVKMSLRDSDVCDWETLLCVKREDADISRARRRRDLPTRCSS